MSRILLPENTLLTLCGIAGCGKSSFAARHFSPTQIVSSDDCRAQICDDEASQLVTSHAFEMWRFIIRKRLLLQRFTVADATNLERGDRRWLTKIAQHFGFHSAIMVFNLPFELCLARNATRTRVVPEEALRRQHDWLRQTLQTIHSEQFDFVFILNELEQSQTTIGITASRFPHNESCQN